MRLLEREGFILGIMPILFKWLITGVAAGVVLSLAASWFGMHYVGFYSLATLAYWSPDVYGNVHTRFLIPMVPFLCFFLVRGTVSMARLALAGNVGRIVLAGVNCSLNFGDHSYPHIERLSRRRPRAIPSNTYMQMESTMSRSRPAFHCGWTLRRINRAYPHAHRLCIALPNLWYAPVHRRPGGPDAVRRP